MKLSVDSINRINQIKKLEREGYKNFSKVSTEVTKLQLNTIRHLVTEFGCLKQIDDHLDIVNKDDVDLKKHLFKNTSKIIFLEYLYNRIQNTFPEIIITFDEFLTLYALINDFNILEKLFEGVEEAYYRAISNMKEQQTKTE